MTNSFSRIAIAIALLSFALVTTSWAKPTWPHEGSDLQADPLVTFGELPNGMRYAVKRNGNPEGTVSFALRIHAGSLHENDNERGVAHFLEHMAFNGSENYPEGEMFRALQRMGIQIGSSANASTDYDNTTFSLSLPSVRSEVVNTGLKILREISSRLTISKEAIDRERGVIQSEERARDTAAMRASLTQIGLLFAGQKYAVRPPIGASAFIQSAGPAQLRSFYERHYRPERTLLVVAGDFDPSDMIKRIHQTFGDWVPSDAKPSPSDFGVVKKRGLTAGLMTGPSLEENVSISWVQPEDKLQDSKAKRRDVHHRIVAFTVLNRRLGKLSRTGNAPYIDARLDRDAVAGAGIITTLSVRTKSGGWARGLDAAEQELRRALKFGFQQSEVEREALEQKSPYLLAAKNANTRTNMDVAELLMSSISSNRVPTDVQTDLELYASSISGIKASGATSALKSAVTGAGPILFLTSGSQVAGGEQSLLQAYQRSLQVAVSPPPKDQIKSFSYRDFGVKGQVVSRDYNRDIETLFVRFANGVRVNVKPTNFERDKVSVVVRMPGGYLALPKSKKGLGWVMPFAFVEGGLGRLEMHELEQTEPGHFAGINLDVDEDKFQLSGDTVERDVLLQLQVLAAFATDPAYRSDGLRRIQEAIDGQLNEAYSKPSGVLSREIQGLVRAGDGRWAAATVNDIRALTMDDVRQAIAPTLASAPIEITIVGNVTQDAAVEAVAKTFGALPPRRPVTVALGDQRTVTFPRRAQPIILQHNGRGDQAAVAALWPGPDRMGDRKRSYALNVLSEVVQLRLIDEVREAQGGTYTPFGHAMASNSVKGFGYFMAGVEPRPEATDVFFETLRKIVDELRDGELADDLFERARKPVLYQHYAAESTNAYWVGALSDVQSDPQQLERIRNAVADLQALKPADIVAAAKQYLVPEELVEVKVLPRP